MPLTEADLIDEPAPSLRGAAQPAPPMATPVFSAEAPLYEAEAVPLGRTLPPAPYKPPPPVKKKKAKRRSTRSAAATLGLCVAGFVFIFILPSAGIMILLAIAR